MNVLLLGSGAREHAIAWKISQSPLMTRLFISPGNGGTDSYGTQVDLSSDFKQIKDFVIQENIEMVVVGPEVPLVNGITDCLHQHLPDLRVIGPDKTGAQLEGSKDFSKQFMQQEDIPTADYHTIHQGELDMGHRVLEKMSPPYVLKADGLAAGKGVIITSDLTEAKSVLEDMLGGQFGEASARVVIESFLTGIEFSVFALVDGENCVLLPIAKDYKRIGEGDTGPNTGGMGAISPVSFIDADLKSKVIDRIINPTIKGLKKRNINYCGFIFFGLINCDGNPYVIEYNCRLGDPETQVVLPRLKTDLLELFILATDKKLDEAQIEIDPRYVANVVLASAGYPGKYEKGKGITAEAHINSELLFHAGTLKEGNKMISNGGRVMSCCAYGDTLKEAITEAYKVVHDVHFDNKIFRKDIGQDLLSFTSDQ